MVSINLSKEQAVQIYTILMHSAPNNNASKEATTQIENQLMSQAVEQANLASRELRGVYNALFAQL